MSELKSSERAQNRPKRVPLGNRNRLSVKDGTIPKGFVGRWINNSTGRVEAALEAGYKFIDGDGKVVGDTRVADPAQMGSQISKAVGSGVTAYLMAIPEEFYKEDQAAKQKSVDSSEAAMKAPPKKLTHEGKAGDGRVYGPGLTDD